MFPPGAPTDHWPPSKPYRTIFITGGNTGLGLATIRALYTSTQVYDIFLGCRDYTAGQEVVAQLQQEFSNSESVVTAVQCDVCSDDSIMRAFEFVRGLGVQRVDGLVCNAGANFDMAAAKGQMSVRQAFNASFDTNVSGAHIVTSVFAPLLIASKEPRLLFITSGVSSLAGAAAGNNGPMIQPPHPGWPKAPSPIAALAYRASKTALNMLMLDWARVLSTDGVKVFAVSPGFLATGLASESTSVEERRVHAEVLSRFGAGEASDGARVVKEVLEGARDKDAGKVVRDGGVLEW